MTGRVDFYVLKSDSAKLRWTFACRLTEKAYLRDLTVVVLNENAADTEVMDELLWTFNERSFVPHAIHRKACAVDTGAVETAALETAAVDVGAVQTAWVDAVAADATPVRLTPDLDTIEGADLLVNLSGRLPARLERFARIAEVIDADAERRRLGRERFKAYRELKLTLETHQLDDGADA